MLRKIFLIAITLLASQTSIAGTESGLTKEKILEVVRSNTLVILPKLNPTQITTEKTLEELGVNELDRDDISAMSAEELGLRIPPIELRSVNRVQDLIDVLYRYKHN